MLYVEQVNIAEADDRKKGASIPSSILATNSRAVMAMRLPSQFEHSMPESISSEKIISRQKKIRGEVLSAIVYDVDSGSQKMKARDSLLNDATILIERSSCVKITRI